MPGASTFSSMPAESSRRWAHVILDAGVDASRGRPIPPLGDWHLQEARTLSRG